MLLLGIIVCILLWNYAVSGLISLVVLRDGIWLINKYECTIDQELADMAVCALGRCFISTIHYALIRRQHFFLREINDFMAAAGFPLGCRVCLPAGCPVARRAHVTSLPHCKRYSSWSIVLFILLFIIYYWLITSCWRFYCRMAGLVVSCQRDN